MDKEYTKDYFWEIYKQLPEELKDALFSDKNNELVTHICVQSGLKEEQVSIVAKYVGRVIMGLLPLDELPITIELELNISQDLSSQINRQIYISIFKHLRVSLNKINNRNSEYKDVFTSSKDGIIEESREETPKTPPRTFTPPPRKEFIQNINPIAAKLERIEEKTAQPLVDPEPEIKPAPEIKPEPEVFKPAPVNEKPLPENPVFEKPAPNIPSRDAFKSSLEDIDIKNVEIPTFVKDTKIPEIPAMEIPETSPEDNDPYKEAPI
ncbi:MAG: hypothetical protein PHW52_00570 [Candidatus Pacebacteria bacterium]|nr:hypothetical protein [Candidatus Paceibacterota bacterium]